MAARLKDEAENAAFRHLLSAVAADSGGELELSSPTSFELLMPGEIPVRATVHPDGESIVVDAYVYNAAMITGPLRASMVQSMLLLNHAALRGRRFAVGLDSRDFVFVTARLPLGATTAETFWDDLDYLAGQAARVRELVAALTLAGAEDAVDLSVRVPADAQ
ncbi:MAG TPA: hypothetical protein VEC19_17580 [Usitatibacter sp.]|nr:hypothetical protein [Usitatibacter sp.]